MTIYVDSSALLSRYLHEPDADRFDAFLEADPDWICARHTWVEVRRTLARDLHDADLADARAQFDGEWSEIRVVELDRPTCDLAAEFTEITGARTLDALHLAAAHRTGGGAMTFVTADFRQAQAARSLGWIVLGA